MYSVKSKYLVASSDQVLTDHALIVSEGKIVDILPQSEADEKYPGIDVLDRPGSIVMPGFINAHMHQYGVLSRGIPVNASFEDFEGFLNDYWWPHIENRIDLDVVKTTAVTSAIELLESGVTGFCDTLEAPNVERGALIEQAKIIDGIGMKAVLSLESCERISRENGMKCLEENAELIKWSRENCKNVQGIMCTHTSFTCSDEFLNMAKEKARKLNAPWQLHISESIYEVNHCVKDNGVRPVEHYDGMGLLGSDVLASQCVKVDEKEMEILAKRGVNVVHMPLSNCEVGGGFSPVPEMLEKGIDVALGTDGYVNNFFEVMRGAFLMHKSRLENAGVMPARAVFKMATSNGAKALGWDDAGELKIGNSADFTVLEDRFKTPVTFDNIFDQIVVHADKDFVSDVHICGKAVMEYGRILTADKKQAENDMRESARIFWNM